MRTIDPTGWRISEDEHIIFFYLGFFKLLFILYNNWFKNILCEKYYCFMFTALIYSEKIFI